jgi:hypothetical protein
MLLVRQPCVCYVLSVCEGGARCCPSRLDTWNSDAASAVALCELRRGCASCAYAMCWAVASKVRYGPSQ